MDRDKKVFWLVALATLLVQAYALIEKEWFFTWVWGDVLIHFLYGAVMFLFFVIFLRWKPTDALLAVLAWQILWEGMEMIDDRLNGDTGVDIDNMFFDGIKDTAVNIAGGLLGWLLWLPVRTHEMFEKRLLRIRLWVYFMSAALLPMILIGSYIYVHTGTSPNHFAVVWMLAVTPAVTLLAKFLPLDYRKEKRTHKSKPLTS